MSDGAIITMSGEAHKGFHQCPNFIRDKYLPLIKLDGYGYINYILSWANSGQALSQRRMMKDLGCGQGKLVAIQQRVLQYCGHFISKTEGSAAAPGKLGVPNRWHIDAEIMWGENAIHLAAQAQKRLEARAAQVIGESVSKTDTPPDSLAGSVSKTDTCKRQGNTSPKQEEAPMPETGEVDSTLNASSSGKTSPEDLLEALLDEAEGGQEEGITAQPANTASLHGSDLSEAAIGQGRQQNTQPTAVEEVPGGAAAPDEVAAVNAQLDRYLNKRWLSSYQLGDTKMPPLSTEVVGGLDRREIASLISLEQLREFHNEARRNMSQRRREQETNPGLAGLNYTTELLRLLQEHAEQRLAIRELVQQRPAGEGASSRRVSGRSEWQVGDRVVYMRERHEIVAVTPLKITVALLSDPDIQCDIIRSSMTPSTLRPYVMPEQRTG
ncbi:hypothetical protein GCM10017783_25450 [Deinococcus piscis]|uniref:Uncharacterized protein n=1 Tax=Deinococcus piscis TaxID=394230 RepID=A0ABQ3KBW6_9DEIO|nr:hypothetical protein [Deinococcus piscis]GHG12162.1 hypothetical protein GCM10017783_25450 [Deinococcus piscis]